MATKIKDSHAIVTGGAQGIGFEMCRHLLMEGAKIVAILDIDETTGQKSVEKLKNEFGNGRALFIAVDLTKIDQFEEIFKKAVEELEGLEILINNAGIADAVNWSLMIDLNIKSVVHGTMLAISHMGKHKGGNGGTVINIGSLTAFVNKDNPIPIYSATKSAVVSFSHNIGSHYGLTGVSVKTICLGRVDTYQESNITYRFLDYMDHEQLIKKVLSVPAIKAEEVAPDVMRLIEDPSNNAVWAKAANLPTSSIDLVDENENSNKFHKVYYD